MDILIFPLLGILPTNTWVCLKMLCTPLYPMVFMIIIPFLNGYFIGGIPHFQTYPYCYSLFFLNSLNAITIAINRWYVCHSQMGLWHCLPTLSGWWFQTCFIFHSLYGMSSFPLTNSIILQDGYCNTNQILSYFQWWSFPWLDRLYRKSLFSMGKSTISMAIFNSYVNGCFSWSLLFFINSCQMKLQDLDLRKMASRSNGRSTEDAGG